MSIVRQSRAQRTRIGRHTIPMHALGIKKHVIMIEQPGQSCLSRLHIARITDAWPRKQDVDAERARACLAVANTSRKAGKSRRPIDAAQHRL